MKIKRHWNRPDRYVLDDDGNPLAMPDLHAWCEWMESSHRRVAYDEFGDVSVSTVFLGLDHNFYDDGPPVLWETMIFGGPHDMYQNRYTSREDALDGHDDAIWKIVGMITVEPRRKR